MLWGSSFLLIRIGVDEISATQLVFIRTGIAAIGLNIVRTLRGKSLPSDWRTLRALLIIGVGNTAIPFTLISLGEQYITSGMASVLQATASLFSLVIAHLAFADERITRHKVAGLIVGFGGVVMLSSSGFDGGEIDVKFILGQLAVVIASLFYAGFTTYSRKVIKRNVEPVVVSSTAFISAATCAGVFMLLEPLLGGRAFVAPADIPTDTLLAVIQLGFFNTFLAYLLFYFIVWELGAFRATMVTYVVPAVGLFLSALAGETVTPVMIGGALMIFTGIAIINLRPAELLLRFKTGVFSK